MPFSYARYLVVMLLAIMALWAAVTDRSAPAGAQEAKRYSYKVVDVLPDNAAMQAILNEYGAAGWELIAIGMGDMTAPRLIFKK